MSTVPAQLNSLKTVNTRIEATLEDLSTTTRNTARAVEVLRLDSDERVVELQKALDALVGEVDQLHKRVTTAATTAAAASATAQAAALTAQAVASDAAKTNTGVAIPPLDISNLSRNGTSNSNGARSPTGGNGAGGKFPLTPAQSGSSIAQTLGQSLMWTPPEGAGVDPWAPTKGSGIGGVADPALNPSLNRLRSASSASRQLGLGRTRSLSSNTRRRASAAAGELAPTSPLSQFLAWADPRSNVKASLAQQVVRYVVHALLVPVKISQALLHNIVRVLGVAGDPSSPTIGSKKIR
jgi:hypothetical protein